MDQGSTPSRAGDRILAHLSFRGRIGREAFWTVGVLLMMAKVVLVGSTALVTRGGADPEAWRWTVWTVMTGLDLILLWPFLSLQVRRAHDRDRSGKLAAGVLLAATAWAMVPPPMRQGLGTGEPALTGLLGAAVLLELVFVQGCLPGTNGPNRYGPAPGRPADAAPAL